MPQAFTRGFRSMVQELFPPRSAMVRLRKLVRWRLQRSQIQAACCGQALEQSNVDIAAEFSDLIVAQRAFEANSKTVTTFDTVTQQAINMIR